MNVENRCQLWGYSRQAYHKSLRVVKNDYLVEQQALLLIKGIRERQPRSGGLKLWQMLMKSDVSMGRDAIYDLLGRHNLLVKSSKKHVRTTDSSGWLRQFSNLVKGLEITRVNQVWVSDITYVHTREGFAFLSLITDAYSRAIIGFRVHPTLDREGPLAALEMALKETGKEYKQSIIHHSDRGCQYCSADYVKKLGEYHIKPSTTQDGSPYDNAIAERVNGILKSEWLDLVTFDDIKHVERKVEEVIGIYNNERCHMGINYNIPREVYQGEKVGKAFVMF